MIRKLIIDLTDDRFKIPANEAVLDFVCRGNSSAHSDVGSLLFDLAKVIPGAHAYCPLVSSFTYVVLHTDADRIYAIAFGMRGLAFRLAPSAYDAALADGARPADQIGAGWVEFDPFERCSTPRAADWLRVWGERALAHAMELDGGTS